MNETHGAGTPAAEDTGLSAGSPPDILAFVPHCLGFEPEESLVLIALRGLRLGATLRLDLPGIRAGRESTHSSAEAAGPHRAGDFARAGDDTAAGEDPAAGEGHSAAAYRSRICSLLARDPEADSVLIVVYTRQPWNPGEPPPYSGMVARLREDLAEHGLELRDGWLSGNEHWRDYFCASQECCPWPGFPLDEIAGSRLNAELVYRGSAYSQTLQAAVGLSGGRLRGGGPADPVTARSEEACRRRFDGRWTTRRQFARTLDAWDQCFRGYRSPRRDGLLLASLESRPIRDTVLVLAALGLQTALAGSRYWLAADVPEVEDANGEGPGADVTGAEAAAGVPGDDAAGAAGPSDRAGGEAGRIFRSVLIGRSSEAPDWEHLDRAYNAFTSLLGAASGEPAAALLTLLGWLEWARGRSSRADLCLIEALDIQPEYRLAQLLRELLRRGELPEWAQSPQTAWRRGGAA